MGGLFRDTPGAAWGIKHSFMPAGGARPRRRRSAGKEAGAVAAERILLVEDEVKLSRFVELELVHEGYQVDKAFDGRTGLDMAQTQPYDLLLLDVMLPGLSGPGAAAPGAQEQPDPRHPAHRPGRGGRQGHRAGHGRGRLRNQAF